MGKPIFKILYTEFCLRRMRPHAIKCGYLYRLKNSYKSLEELRQEGLGAGPLLEIVLRGNHDSKIVRHAKAADKWCARSLKYWDEIEPYI